MEELSQVRIKPKKPKKYHAHVCVLSRSLGSALHAWGMNMNNRASEINIKPEIERLQELLDEKTKELEAAHQEIAALVSFICKSKNLSVNAKHTPDGQDVIPNSKF